MEPSIEQRLMIVDLEVILYLLSLDSRKRVRLSDAHTCGEPYTEP